MRTKITLGFAGELDGYDTNQVIAITFAQAKWNDIQARGGTLSNRFGLNKTANNKRVLGLLDDVKSQQNQAYELHQCKIEVEGLPVFFGVASIEESSDKYYLRVFASISDLFSLMGDDLIGTIDLSAFDHDYNAANVNVRRSVLAEVVYPNINYGLWTGEPVGARDFREFVPAVSIEQIINLGVQKYGYTTVNFTTPRYIPFSKEIFEATLSTSCDCESTTGKTLITDPDLNINDRIMYFDNIVNNRNGFIKQRTTSFGKQLTYISFGDDATGSVTIRASFSYVKSVSSGVDFEITLVADGLAIAKPVLLTSGTSGDIVIEAEVQTDTPATEVEFDLRIFDSTLPIPTGSVDILSGAILEVVSGRVSIVKDSNVPVEDTLPEISLKDLILDEATRLNSLLIVDPIAKTLEFAPMNEIANRTFESKDWSDKINLLKDPKTEYRIKGYAQTSYLEYEEGTELDVAYSADPTFGRGQLNINDGTLEAEKVIYKSPFAATGKGAAFEDGVQILLIPRYSEPTLSYLNPDNDPNPRVLILDVNDDVLVDIIGQAVLPNQVNGRFETYEEIINDNYGALQSILEKTKRIELPIRLSATDIQELDFTKPVFLLGEYWFIQEVKQWKANVEGTTLVKLLRL